MPRKFRPKGNHCEYMRCPLCWRLVMLRGAEQIPGRFLTDVGDQGQRKLGVRLQFFEGQGVIRWDDRTFTPTERLALDARLSQILHELRTEQIEKDIMGAKTLEEAERIGARYVKQSGEAVELAQQELEFRREEIEQLLKQRQKAA